MTNISFYKYYMLGPKSENVINCLFYKHVYFDLVYKSGSSGSPICIQVFPCSCSLDYLSLQHLLCGLFMCWDDVVTWKNNLT